MGYSTPTPKQIIAHLTNQEAVGPISTFPRNPNEADQPGLYAWWVDDDGRRELSDAIASPVASLLYVGED